MLVQCSRIDTLCNVTKHAHGCKFKILKIPNLSNSNLKTCSMHTKYVILIVSR